MKFLPGIKEVTADVKYKLGSSERYIANKQIKPLDTNDRDKSKWVLVLLTEVEGGGGEFLADRKRYERSILRDTRWMCHVKRQLGDRLEVWKLRMNKTIISGKQYTYPTTIASRQEAESGAPECFDKYLTLSQFSKGYALEQAYMGWLGEGNYKQTYSATLPSAVLIDPEGNVRKRYGFGKAIEPSYKVIVSLAPHIGVELPKDLSKIGKDDRSIFFFPYKPHAILEAREELASLPSIALSGFASHMKKLKAMQ